MEIKYVFRKIETQQFAIFPEKLMVGKPVQVNATFSYNVDFGSRLIKCSVKLSYEQNDKVILLLEMTCSFEFVEGFESLKKKDKVEIPVEFLRYLGSLVVGTARGVIHVKTEGTVLNGVILPQLNLNEFVINDIVAPLEALKNNN